jgi:hydroxyethylthiazole kinase-like uncharacterized protein yjeF
MVPERLLGEFADESGTRKGDNGTVGIVGGSIDYAGPPALSGLAALRTGTDVARILTSEEVLPVVAGYSPTLVVDRYTGDYFSESSVSTVSALADGCDVVVIGPGLSKPEPEAVRRAVSEVEVPLVVDADALAPATEADGDLSDAVFTPDKAEIERLTDEYGSLAGFAERTGATVVETGETDVVYADGDEWTNETGSAAMTGAGTGDVLAGMVASAIGQGMDLVDAAKLGVWLVGKAGERAAAEYGDGLLATDVIESVPRVMY